MGVGLQMELLLLPPPRRQLPLLFPARQQLTLYSQFLHLQLARLRGAHLTGLRYFVISSNDFSCFAMLQSVRMKMVNALSPHIVRA